MQHEHEHYEAVIPLAKAAVHEHNAQSRQQALIFIDQDNMLRGAEYCDGTSKIPASLLWGPEFKTTKFFIEDVFSNRYTTGVSGGDGAHYYVNVIWELLIPKDEYIEIVESYLALESL